MPKGLCALVATKPPRAHTADRDVSPLWRTVAGDFKRARRSLGISQDAVAEAAGMTGSAVSQFESCAIVPLVPTFEAYVRAIDHELLIEILEPADAELLRTVRRALGVLDADARSSILATVRLAQRAAT